MKLAKYIVITIICAAIIATVSTFILNKGLRSSSTDFYEKINTLRDGNNRLDAVVIGSSRALVHVDPKVFDSITGIRSYNSGVNAATIKTCFNLIMVALNKQPMLKHVLLNIDYTMFDMSQDPYKDVYYYPFDREIPALMLSSTGSNHIIHSMRFLDISLHDDYTKSAALQGLLQPSKLGSITNRGFYPSTETFIMPDEKNLLKHEQVFPSEGRQVLANIINECKKRNVDLFLFISPYYKPYHPSLYISNYNEITGEIKKIALENGIPLSDFTDIPIASDSSYFANTTHLNFKGAEIFSQLLAIDFLKQILRK